MMYFSEFMSTVLDLVDGTINGPVQQIWRTISKGGSLDYFQRIGSIAGSDHTSLCHLEEFCIPVAGMPRHA